MAPLPHRPIDRLGAHFFTTHCISMGFLVARLYYGSHIVDTDWVGIYFTCFLWRVQRTWSLYFFGRRCDVQRTTAQPTWPIGLSDAGTFLFLPSLLNLRSQVFCRVVAPIRVHREGFLPLRPPSQPSCPACLRFLAREKYGTLFPRTAVLYMKNSRQGLPHMAILLGW